MIDTEKVKVGDRVRYINHGASNGIVKEVTDHEYIRVVYHCGGDWDNFMNYTGAMTAVRDLIYGWK